MGEERELSVLGHLSELRNRLLKCLLALVAGTSLSFVFAERLFKILIAPASGINLIYVEVTEMVGTYMQVSLAGGVVLAMPYLVYQFLMFILPALTQKEKKYVLILLPGVFLMFGGGVVFGYYVLLPPAIQFLITFGSDIATPQIRISNFVSVMVRLLMAIGLVFELPLITTFLARIGVVDYRWLGSKRKFAIVIAFVLGAVITPTFDPVNQTLVALPLIILYEVGIWLAWLVGKKKAD